MTAPRPSLNVLDAGPADGEPVVLIHGLVCSTYSFRYQTDALVAAGYRVIVPDLPGHGESYTPGTRDAYTSDAMVESVRAVLTERGIEHPHLAGHSMGAAIALDLAAIIAPRTLTLLSPAGLGDVRLIWLWRTLTSLPLGTILRRVLLPRWVFAIGLRIVYGRRARLTRDVIDQYWRRSRREGHAWAIWELLNRFNWRARDGAHLRQVQSPTLIVHGDSDVIIDYGRLSERVRGLPGASVHVSRGAGHLVIEEAPEEVNPLMLAHLRGVPALS